MASVKTKSRKIVLGKAESPTYFCNYFYTYYWNQNKKYDYITKFEIMKIGFHSQPVIEHSLEVVTKSYLK